MTFLRRNRGFRYGQGLPAISFIKNNVIYNVTTLVMGRSLCHLLWVKSEILQGGHDYMFVFFCDHQFR